MRARHREGRSSLAPRGQDGPDDVPKRPAPSLNGKRRNIGARQRGARAEAEPQRNAREQLVELRTLFDMGKPTQ